MEANETFEELLRQLEHQAQARKNTDTNHINTRFPLDTIKRIDGVCHQFKTTRSDVIKNAVNYYLAALKSATLDVA